MSFLSVGRKGSTLKKLKVPNIRSPKIMFVELQNVLKDMLKLTNCYHSPNS